MSTITGTLANWLNEQYTDDNGTPLAGGFIAFKEAGTNTDKDTFAQADLDPSSVNSNPVELDSGGRPPVAIFFQPGLYDCSIYDADMVLIKTVLGVGVPEAEVPPGLALALATGARDVTSGYTVVDTDTMITVNSAAGATTINLRPWADSSQPILIKNMGTGVVTVVPNGSDTIEGSLTSWQVNASGTPNFAAVWLFPDGTGLPTWWVFSKMG